MNSVFENLSENPDGVNIKLQKTAKKFAWFMEEEMSDRTAHLDAVAAVNHPMRDDRLCAGSLLFRGCRAKVVFVRLASKT